MTVPPQDRESPAAEDAEVQARAADRLIFFSDAVVAIAMTLLALALPLPRSGHGLTNAQVLHSLASHRGDYMSFLISFVVIGGYWAAHHRLFRYVVRLGGGVTGLNMLWLLMMVVTPFATRMLNGAGGFAIRFSFYALLQAVSGLCLLALTRQITSHRLLREGAPESGTAGGSVPGLTSAALFLLSIPVSFVTHWAYLLWIAIPFVLRVVRIISRRSR